MSEIETSSKMVAQMYLNLLVFSRDQPGSVMDSLLAELRENVCDNLGGADPEYVQNSFELVADALRLYACNPPKPLKS